MHAVALYLLMDILDKGFISYSTDNYITSSLRGFSVWTLVFVGLWKIHYLRYMWTEIPFIWLYEWFVCASLQPIIPPHKNWLCRRIKFTWRRHQMETFSALLSFSEGNPPIADRFPWQRPETRSFGVFFDMRLNKRLNKQWGRRWFETLLCPLWRHCNGKTCSRCKNDTWHVKPKYFF